MSAPQAIERFWLPVSPVHTLYVETQGQGLPVVFLHGGPGGGFSPKHHQLFDPARFRSVLFDQRGAGRSTPHACLEDNTTGHLVEDLETLRKHLGIEQWLVFGGSWGSTLALAYAQTYPQAVSGLILRGIFLCRPEEIQWFYQEGTSWLFPELWERFQAPIPPEERHEMVAAYYRQLTHPDEAIRLRAAQAWSGWEGATCRLQVNPETIAQFEEPHHALAMARIECHYFMNQAFLAPNQLLNNAYVLANIPTWIVHGRYDVICPARNAWELKQAMPHAQLTIVPDAGHAFDEPGILAALHQALDSYAQQMSPT